jgi:PAS domain S-box-containing protein
METNVQEDPSASLAQAGDQQRFELVENLPALAWMALPDGHIDFYNREWFAYTGTTLAEMQGWGWEKVHDPEMLPKVVARWRHALSTGEPFEMEFPLRSAQGEFRWFLTRIRPLRNARGEIVRWFGMNTDVHELRMQREFQERFLAILGHDLRNPIGAIEMAAGLLQQRGSSDPVTVRVVARIASSTRRMTRIVEQILDLTRTRTGGLPIQPAPMDLSFALRGIVDELRTLHPMARIELNSAPLTGIWDRDRLEQVFSNLIGNAVQHGAPQTAVEVDARASDGFAEVEVRNQGAPVPPGLLAKLFNPFRRGTKDSRMPGTSGLGLGLFISREIARAHGGEINVRSDERGTVFRLRLPLGAAIASGMETPSRS